MPSASTSKAPADARLGAPDQRSHSVSESTSNPARYFGRQVRRARRAAGWTLAEFGQRIGYDPGQISRVENGKRPPTELFARMCDRAFPGREGWFSEFYAESRTWIATPPWFRSWVEHEQRATGLRVWQLGVLSGLLQTADYARAILTVNPGVTEDEVSARLAARLERQEVLTREDPPAAWFLVDKAALRRRIGPPEIMTAQLAHLAGVARLPNVTVQVVPSTAHAGLLGGFALTERAAYVETAVAGQVFEDAEIIAALLTRFDTLRSEAFRGSESLALIERMCEEWKATGGKAVTQATTAASA
jgi:transcriptional regulator with XRE-family HTH domain